MKKSIRNFAVLTFVFLILLVACSKDETEEFLSVEDAKIEIRAASQEMMITAADMMETPALYSMEFLMQLMGQEDFGATMKAGIAGLNKPYLPAINRLIRDESSGLKNLQTKGLEIDNETKGVFTFNFETNEFDLTNAEIDYLQLVFPADETAFAAGNNNATLTVSDLEFTSITHTDDTETWTENILSGADVSLVVDSDEILSILYDATFNEDGIPTSLSLMVDADPWELTLSLNGSGVNYNSALLFKKGNDVIVSFNLTFKYSAELDDVDEIAGFFEAGKLRFEGEVKIAAIENCGESVECVNQNIDVKVKQTRVNKIIGHLELRLYEDYWGDVYPQPVIVYKDGSWEYLHDILGIDLK